MYTTKINQRGQITIPKELREKFNLKPGTEVLFDEVEGHLVIERGAVVPEWFARMGKQVAEGISDVHESRYKDFDTIDDLLDDLNA